MVGGSDTRTGTSCALKIRVGGKGLETENPNVRRFPIYPRLLVDPCRQGIASMLPRLFGDKEAPLSGREKRVLVEGLRRCAPGCVQR